VTSGKGNARGEPDSVAAVVGAMCGQRCVVGLHAVKVVVVMVSDCAKGAALGWLQLEMMAGWCWCSQWFNLHCSGWQGHEGRQLLQAIWCR
jgi:hypothetical protein